MSDKRKYWHAVLGTGAGLLALSTAVWAQNPVSKDHIDWPLLEKYCGDCHNADDQAGSIAFEDVSRDPVTKDAATWEKAIRKIRTGMMPPGGKPRPPRVALDGFVASL